MAIVPLETAGEQRDGLAWNARPDSEAAFIRVRSRSIPRWLFYSLITIVVWAFWGIAAKLPTGGISPIAIQAISCIGMLPLALGLLLAPRL
ncbi:MAG: hypothetical protein ACT4QC_10715, partial [Planctomycetaceae bacterium]